MSKGNFINGEWKNGTGKRFVSISPSDENIIWEGNVSTESDVKECVLCAKNAFDSWSKIPLENRVSFIHKFTEIVKENIEELARTISMEIGKPLWEAKTEVSSVIGKLDISVKAYKERCGESIKELANGGISKTQFKPLGVVAVIGPYNFPCHMPNGHIMPALIAGNVVILKPSEQGALCAEKMMELWEMAGLPQGVISMVQGDGSTGEKLVECDNINGVFFTGSYGVGERIRLNCHTEKICALEMGGNSPLVVWDTSNIDAAVISTIQSAFITSGQRCSAARRLIVPESNFGKEFLNRLIKVTEKISVGKYNDNNEHFMGPVRNEAIVNSIINEQNRLVKRGAKILVECKQLVIGKCFITPGIIDITDVKENLDDEITGPFLRVKRVNSFDEAIFEANNTNYGLAAGIFTEDQSLYERFNQEVKAGIINWNQQLSGASGGAPFGGIKKSGNFRPSGYFATDYCSYAVASIEIKKLNNTTYPVGITL